jgi:hypothetical protein
MELKGKLRLNNELERTQKEALLQYLATGSEEIHPNFRHDGLFPDKVSKCRYYGLALGRNFHTKC